MPVMTVGVGSGVGIGGVDGVAVGTDVGTGVGVAVSVGVDDGVAVVTGFGTGVGVGVAVATGFGIGERVAVGVGVAEAFGSSALLTSDDGVSLVNGGEATIVLSVERGVGRPSDSDEDSVQPKTMMMLANKLNGRSFGMVNNGVLIVRTDRKFITVDRVSVQVIDLTAELNMVCVQQFFAHDIQDMFDGTENDRLLS